MAEETTLTRTFAPMLAELEDAEVKLTADAHRLARELEAVSQGIEHIQTVKAAMLGAPAAPTNGTTPPRRGKKRNALDPDSRAGHMRAKRDRIMAWARERDTPFKAVDVAEALELPRGGVGPICTGLAQNGLLELIEAEDGGRMYRVTP